MNNRIKRIWTNSDIWLNNETTDLTAQLNGLSCPKCGSQKYIKSGKEKGNQRYLCKKCGKHFRSTTGNTIHHLHLKPKIQQYINCMNEGLSLRKTAKECDISLRTAFRWRHRFLNAMSRQPETIKHKGDVISTLNLPYSHKGQKGTKPLHTKTTSVVQIGIEGKVSLYLLGKYGQTVTNVAKAIATHTAVIRSRAMPKLIKAKAVTRPIEKQIHQTQTVNHQIHNWLIKFRGVATKYLENYWKWFMLNRKLKLQNNMPLQYMCNCF